MKREDAEEYTQSLGQIVAGSWRQIALAQKLGVPQALGMPLDRWVNDRLGGYIKLSIADRREAVKELTANGHSNRETADILGISRQTVNNDAGGKTLSAEPEEISNSNDVSGPDGKNLPPIDSERQRQLEAAEVEREKRETLLRIAEGLYRNGIAFSVAGFQAAFHERLQDKTFKNLLIDRLRFGSDGPEVEDFLDGADELAKILGEINNA